MKRLLAIFSYMVVAYTAAAQVPNFGGSVGNQKLYGYSSMKFRASVSSWETYYTLQYGITDYFQIGADLYTGTFSSYVGYILRGGYKFSPYFKIGAQLTPSFNLNDGHKFGYLTSALYMNGQITSEGKMFWVTNTWLENDKHRLNSAKQWSYFGYSFGLPGDGNSITPMAGVIHSWKFDQPADLSLGAYYTHRNISLYAWTNDILTDHPRFIIAVEFTFSNK